MGRLRGMDYLQVFRQLTSLRNRLVHTMATTSDTGLPPIGDPNTLQSQAVGPGLGSSICVKGKETGLVAINRPLEGT